MPKKTPKRNSRLTVIVAAVAAVVVAFVAMNIGYLSARMSLKLRGPMPVNAPPPPPQADPEIPGVVPEWRMEPDRLLIPSLGIDVPLVYIEEKNEAAFQAALRDGVVHYPGTAMPGQPGNAYYFGHSSDYSWSKGEYKNVFATLTEIEIGARIIVSDADGRGYEYAVTGTRVVSPKDLSVLEQGDGTKAMLSLQTSYPLGTALKRFVASAELVQ